MRTMNNNDVSQLGCYLSPLEIAFIEGNKIYLDHAYSLIGDPPLNFKNFTRLFKLIKKVTK
jgi:hypothetical protein